MDTHGAIRSAQLRALAHIGSVTAEHLYSSRASEPLFNLSLSLSLSRSHHLLTKIFANTQDHHKPLFAHHRQKIYSLLYDTQDRESDRESLETIVKTTKQRPSSHIRLCQKKQSSGI